MKRASDLELDVGFEAAHALIQGLRQQIFYARSPYEKERLEERLDQAIADLDMIEREQIRRLQEAETVYCSG